MICCGYSRATTVTRAVKLKMVSRTVNGQRSDGKCRYRVLFYKLRAAEERSDGVR